MLCIKFSLSYWYVSIFKIFLTFSEYPNFTVKNGITLSLIDDRPIEKFESSSWLESRNRCSLQTDYFVPPQRAFSFLIWFPFFMLIYNFLFVFWASKILWFQILQLVLALWISQKKISILISTINFAKQAYKCYLNIPFDFQISLHSWNVLCCYKT